jgi:predicted AAA+ superfamily ATPase
MYLKRNVDKSLFDWKLEPSRKPLLIRGARQIGKTSAVRHLADSFDHYIEVNFEESQSYKKVFESGLDILEIAEQISLLSNRPLLPGKTLLFLDEIQSCPEAISLLRFFYEKIPDLHVIAAGSLLEFALSELSSFGVGRVRSVFMYPLSFDEFLNATGEQAILKYLEKADFKHTLSEPIHSKLLLLHKKFMIVGGMPEAVKALSAGKTMLEVQRILDDLVISVQDDFAKYKSRFSAQRLVEVFNAIVMQTGKKFSYSYPNATLNYSQIKEAIELLRLAGLIYPVTHSASNGIPLGAEINPKKTKYLIFDTGIYQRLLGLEIGELMIMDDFSAINKGNIAELVVGLELIKSEDPYVRKDLYYWHREAKNSQAEVDYVHQFGRQIVPIEVKSGTKGSMQSLFLFLEEKNIPFGLRISSENFGEIDRLKILPLYAVHRTKELLC